MHAVELLAYEWRYLTFRASAANSLVQVLFKKWFGGFFCSQHGCGCHADSQRRSQCV